MLPYYVQYKVTPRLSREFLWTALTRATDFKNVFFFQYRDAEQEKQEQKLKQYLKNKIEGYKQQDKKANRELNLDNYVDVDWCLDRLNETCGKCVPLMNSYIFLNACPLT